MVEGRLKRREYEYQNESMRAELLTKPRLASSRVWRRRKANVIIAP